MYCGKCGAKINENEKFCSQCGFPVKRADTKVNQTDSGRGRTNNTPHKKMKIVPILVIAIVILAGVFLLFKTMPSAKKVGLKACKSALEGDIDTYYELLTPSYKEYMAGSGGWYSSDEEFKSELSSYEADMRNDIAASCGENFKAKYKVDSVIECDKSDLEAVKRELERDFGYNSEEVTGAALVTVSIQAYGSEGADVFTREITCVKIGHSWYVHRTELNSL